MNSIEENDSIREMFRRAMPDDLPAAVEHSMQRRLTAFRERFDTPAASEPLGLARFWNRLARWMGGLTMRQRIALGGGGMVAVLGLLLLWGGIIAKPVSAMEKMAEEIRKAKSYKHTGFSTSGGEGTRRSSMTEYWLAPDLKRLEASQDGAWEGPGPQATNIVPGRNKPWISINHQTKTFHRCQPQFEDRSPVLKLENLGKFFGNADRELGTKEISGKKARGFEIDTMKIDPDYPFPATMEIWLDTKTNLPVRVRYDTKNEGHSETTYEIGDIQWNVELDPVLFDPTPPEGYKDDTPKTPASEKQIRQITEALRIYAELRDRHYPQTKVGIIEFTKLRSAYPMVTTKTEHGKATARNDSDRKTEIVSEKVSKTFAGFTLLQEIHNFNPDAAYYGKMVGPKDKDKVLLRWKLDDERYEVIFGDLRAEIVTAERLRALEAK
jgi:outer membrane lipoprotein-sorting protein